MKIDKESGIPIYFQLAEQLKMKIRARELPPGAALPSEHMLTENYAISRGTVRKALQLLMQDGLIETYPGKGSVVSHVKLEYDAGKVLGFFSTIVKDAGKTPSALILEMTELERAPEFVREKLQLEDNDPVLYLRRVRLVDQEPWAIETAYFRESVAALLKDVDLSRSSIYETLQEKQGAVFKFSTNRISATLLDTTMAGLLESAPGSAALKVTRLVHLDNEVPFEYSEDIYRADRICLGLTVNYQQQGAQFSLSPRTPTTPL
jgi:GntR family transcriptional regulator